MTEHEWNSCGDPVRLVEFVWGMGIDRKLRLFACACVRRVWGQLTDLRSREAIEMSERFADGAAGKEELRSAAKAADLVLAESWPSLRWRSTSRPHSKKRETQLANYRAASAAAEAAGLQLHGETVAHLANAAKSGSARAGGMPLPEVGDFNSEDQSQA